ncbi:MAG TPA: hypothetical protein PKH77_22295 [Anaerolineae bacterium]|nr:hypothetical protein [Anaerolineae bacterium]
MKHLLLFDVDSVLVEATGYLRGLQDTVAHFSRRMGVGEHPPTEDDIRAGEAFGLTSEWDSAPTYISALLLARLRLEPEYAPPVSFADALEALGARPRAISRPDYVGLVAQVGGRLRQMGGATAPAARAELWEQARSLPPAQRDAFGAWLDALFGHTHDFAQAPITQHFQNLVIGSAAISATYGVAALFDSPPYLREYDVPLLDDAVRGRLLALLGRTSTDLTDGTDGRISPVNSVPSVENLGAVLYTARPSLPPADVSASRLGYSPEAEIARALVGLEGLPLIGLGHLQWLAERVGADVATLVKPSPVQALAAISAAASGGEAAALEAAWELYSAHRLSVPLSGLGAVAVHIFEDSAGGLRAVRDAVAALKAAGVAADFRPYGITPATGAKAEAMAGLGVTTYRSVNDALAAALALITVGGD